MEALGVQSDLITKLSNIYWILQYYSYAYESVYILRCLCIRTRKLWFDHQDAIVRILKKQTIEVKSGYREFYKIDDVTIKIFKRGDRYKLFKFYFMVNEPHLKLDSFYKMLDEMPDIEIERIKIDSSISYNILDTLSKKPMFKSEQDLYRIIDCE